MTNRLELNWKLDGFVDEQRYYCSETPIDPANPPTPKAILAGDVRTYTDTVVEAGKNYYVRLGSVKNAREKISSEVAIYNVISLLNFQNNIIDARSRVWTPKITPVFVDNALQLVGNGLETPYTSDFDWVGNSYTIECFVKASSWSTWSEPSGIPILIGRMNKNAGINQWSFGPTSVGRLNFYYYSEGQKILITSINTLPLNELVHISFCISSTHAYVSINGVVTSVTLPSNISLPPVSENINIGSYNGKTISGFLGGIRITKGAAKYTSNFTPPQRPF